MPDDQQLDETSTIRGLIILVFVGFVLVITALLTLLWPTGQFGSEGVETIPHLMRVFRPLLSESSLNLPRRILDIAIYAVVVAGIGFLITAWRRGSRGALLGLMAVAALGLSYVSAMALYTGPMISTCGYLLILFGALVAWSATRGEAQDPMQTDELPAEPTDRAADITNLGTDDYGSHPVT